MNGKGETVDFSYINRFALSEVAEPLLDKNVRDRLIGRGTVSDPDQALRRTIQIPRSAAPNGDVAFAVAVAIGWHKFVVGVAERHSEEAEPRTVDIPRSRPIYGEISFTVAIVIGRH